MRTIYLDCSAGVSGDMMLGALCGLLDDPHELERMMEDAGIPHVDVRVERASVSSVSGNRVHVFVHGEEEHQNDDHHHHHGTQGSIEGVISGLRVSESVKRHALEIYGSIASAEAEVHGRPVDEVHFHEVGAMDAVADVVGTCLLMERLRAERIVASPLRTGYGQVRCAHGVLPVPAPATAILLRGVPVFAGDVEGEFTTPTGAALVSHFAQEYGRMPLMSYDRVGTGFGSIETEGVADMLRAFLGESDSRMPTMTQIECNLDDMTPEDLGEALRAIMDDGALDVSMLPATMKKGRPGHMMVVLCRDADRERIARSVILHTSTIGVRMHRCERVELSSRFETVSTVYGDVRVKISEGHGMSKWKPEHDDIAEASERSGKSQEEVRREVIRSKRRPPSLMHAEDLDRRWAYAGIEKVQPDMLVRHVFIPHRRNVANSEISFLWKCSGPGSQSSAAYPIGRMCMRTRSSGMSNASQMGFGSKYPTQHVPRPRSVAWSIMWSVTMDVSVSAMSLPVNLLIQDSPFLANTSITTGAPKVIMHSSPILLTASGDLRTYILWHCLFFPVGASRAASRTFRIFQSSTGRSLYFLTEYLRLIASSSSTRSHPRLDGLPDRFHDLRGGEPPSALLHDEADRLVRGLLVLGVVRYYGGVPVQELAHHLFEVP